MVISILGVIASVIIISLGNTRVKARDTKRKSDLAQIGRFLAMSCYLPETGGSDYDLAEIINGVASRYPQYAQYIPSNMHDPKSGTTAESHYRYVVTADGQTCALYANLENEEEKVTLNQINAPTPGGGTGVWQTADVGWNGSTKYFQFSN